MDTAKLLVAQKAIQRIAKERGLPIEKSGYRWKLRYWMLYIVKTRKSKHIGNASLARALSQHLRSLLYSRRNRLGERVCNDYVPGKSRKRNIGKRLIKGGGAMEDTMQEDFIIR